MDVNNEIASKIEISNAITNNEFILYYQPQFNLVTSHFEGVEVLLRWQHPSKGLLLPDNFISVAENSDMIVQIGEWTLRNACLQAKIWRDKGLAPLRIAINVSTRQLLQKGFVEFIKEVLQETEIEAKYLEFDLTENIIRYHDNEKIIKTIFLLKNSGVQIALDNFGMHDSSIHCLTQIPVDRIKIDKSYILKNNANNNDAAIIREMITLANSLQIQVLAEGVETLKNLKMLLAQECTEAQGFYFTEPLPADALEKFLLFHQNNSFL